MTAALAPSNWNLPNALTLARVAIVPVFGWLLLSDGGDSATRRWWSAALFLLAIATDRIDGAIARKRGLVTNFGKVADPIADKALTGMAFVGLSILAELPWWITALILVREWGITVMRFVVIRHGVMPAGRGGKTKTGLQAVALTWWLLPLWTFPYEPVCRAFAWVLMLAALVVTMATGIDIVFKALRLRQTSERAALKRAARRGRRSGPRQ